MATIRQQILIEAPTRTVWNAITTPGGAAAWWCGTARIDGREGGRVVLEHVVQGENGPETMEERGIIHTWRPTATFEVKWDTGGPSPTRGTSVQFQIGRGDGESKLHVIHSGGGVLDDEAARSALEDLWKERLVRLRDQLEAG